MSDIYDALSYSKKVGRVVTFSEYAEILYQQGTCPDVAECLKHIRDFQRNAPSHGLGDTVSKITGALGISECGGCKKRKELLNRLVPYGN